MPDLKQVQQDAPDVLDQFSSSIGKLSTVLGIVSKLTTLVGIGDLVAQLTKMFIPGQPDPVSQALAAIKQELDVILHFEVADAEKEHMFQVEDLTADARTNWRTLFENNFNFDNQNVNVALMEQNTSKAANELAQQDMYWLRPFYDGLLIVDKQGATFFQGPTPSLDFSLGPGLSQVFDYRLTLPAFLYAIQIRCGFVLSLHSARPSEETDAIVNQVKQIEVRGMLSRLENVYETMIAGIVQVPVPKNHDELLAWDKNGSRMGVVDIYARLGNVEQFFDQGFVQSDFAFAVFQARLGLHDMQHWKDWYAQAGFGHVWSSIQDLRGLLGDPSDPFDRQAAFSIRDIASAMGSTFVADPILSTITIGLVIVGRPGVSGDPILRPLSFRISLGAALSQDIFDG